MKNRLDSGRLKECLSIVTAMLLHQRSPNFPRMAIAIEIMVDFLARIQSFSGQRGAADAFI